MADSEHIKELRAVWGNACHTMWTELTALRVMATYVQGNYRSIGDNVPLTDLVYAPESKGRLDNVTKSVFLDRLDLYLQSVVTGRIVLLSAAFELYFKFFLDAYIRERTKYFEAGSNARTTAGDKLYGDVTKVRGLVARIQKFCELTESGIAGITPLLPALNDVYVLRNAIAHRAGAVDTKTATALLIVKFSEGDRVAVTTEQLLILAEKVLALAAKLDGKISSVSKPLPQLKKGKAKSSGLESAASAAAKVFQAKGTQGLSDWLMTQSSETLRAISADERLVAPRRAKVLSDADLRRAIVDGMLKRVKAKPAPKKAPR